MKTHVLFLLSAILFCTLAPTLAEEHVIQPGDEIAISVLGEPELTKRAVISPQGNITLPYVSEIRVEGMTCVQAAGEITSKLKSFMKNPQVTVELVQSAKMQFTVSGAVHKPGIYELAEGARLVDCITTAGGYSEDADLTRVSVCYGDVATSVDLSKFLLSGETGANIAIRSGATIVVPSRAPVTAGMVTILGAVRNPGQHGITPGMTFREAVMSCGGPTEFADLDNVTLRQEGQPERTLDYAKAVIGDPASNPELKPGDVIIVSAREQMGYYTINGAVMSPGRYEIRGRTTITEAIAIAGGVKDRAKLNEVSIARVSGTASVHPIKMNVGDVMVGKAQNVDIINGDIIYIPAGKERPDFLKLASLALSLAWLISRNH